MSKLPPVIVLCGGKGERIKDLLPMGYPKIMAPVRGGPFVDTLEAHLIEAGFETIIYATGYGHDHLYGYLENKSSEKITRYFSRETEPLGTAGAVRAAVENYHALGENFVIVNGDTICKMNFPAIYEQHCEAKAWATIAVNAEWQNVGTYVVSATIAAFVRVYRLRDLDVLIDDALMEAHAIIGADIRLFHVGEPFCDIGTPEGLASLQ